MCGDSRRAMLTRTPCSGSSHHRNSAASGMAVPIRPFCAALSKVVRVTNATSLRHAVLFRFVGTTCGSRPSRARLHGPRGRSSNEWWLSTLDGEQRRCTRPRALRLQFRCRGSRRTTTASMPSPRTRATSGSSVTTVRPACRTRSMTGSSRTQPSSRFDGRHESNRKPMATGPRRLGRTQAQADPVRL